MQPASNRQAAEIAENTEELGIASHAESTAYEPNSPVDEPLTSQQPEEEVATAKSDRKNWRSDNGHEPFRPEKYRSNISTKVVAGMLSFGAIALVYYALFGGGSQPADAPENWAAGEIDESWVDSNGELEVDLGMEGEIGESSPIAPAFAAEPFESDSKPAEFAPPTAWSPEPSFAPEPTQEEIVEREPPAGTSLTDVLPWQNEPAAPAPVNETNAVASPSADAYAPMDSQIPLNAPMAEATPAQPEYPREMQDAATAASPYPATNYPATDYPATNYPATNYPATNYPATDYPTTNYPSTDSASQYQLPGQSQPPAAPTDQATGPRPWSSPRTAAANYPTTNAPAPSFAPNGTNYPSTNVGTRPYTSDTPREWRR